jgi:hypothetical protein
MAQEGENRRQIASDVRKLGAHVLRDIGVELVEFDMFQTLNELLECKDSGILT